MIRTIGNAGVLIRTPECAVLIDALQRNAVDMYRQLEPEEARAVIDGRPPFDRVDALCFTHAHPDHFSAELTAGFHQKRSDVPIYAGFEEIAALSERGAAPPGLHVVEPAYRVVPVMSCGETELAVTVAAHTGHRYAGVSNRVFVLRGASVCAHPGDAVNSPATLRALANAGAGHGAVLILPFSFALVERGFLRLLYALEPRAVLLHHMPMPEYDAFGWGNTVRRHAALAEKLGVAVRVAEASGQEFDL